MNRLLTLNLILSSLLFICGGKLYCQTYSDATHNPGSDEDRIEVLVKRYNKTHEIRGYRIQIISSSKKDQAKRAKSKFASKYHFIQAHEIYQQPFIIIKVGDFLTKIEAEKFHREIKDDFPGSFVLPDVVDPYDQYSKQELY